MAAPPPCESAFEYSGMRIFDAVHQRRRRSQSSECSRRRSSRRLCWLRGAWPLAVLGTHSATVRFGDVWQFRGEYCVRQWRQNRARQKGQPRPRQREI